MQRRPVSYLELTPEHLKFDLRNFCTAYTTNIDDRTPSTAAMKRSILIAEDDDDTSSLLVRYFRKEGFETLRAANGWEALNLARQRRPCFIILDLMMPGIDGWEVCEELRTDSDIPILILSARQEEADRILGLNLGADDYVVKPFSPREVVARVHAILRRSADKVRPEFETIDVGDLSIDTSRHCVTIAGQSIELTTSEFVLLRTLMSRSGRVFTRNELLNSLHTQGQAVVDRVIDVHVASIRQKIRRVSAQRNYIKTVRGVGYRVDS